jgi:uncharacterized protein (TIGR03437 family)
VIASASNAAVPTATGKAPHSTYLAGVMVTVEGHAAPIVAVAPWMIQFQIPWDVPVNPYPTALIPRAEPAMVLPGGGPLFEAAYPATVYASYPQIFSVAPFDTAHGLPLFALHADLVTPVTYVHPALGGETVTMFGTGFGAVTPSGSGESVVTSCAWERRSAARWEVPCRVSEERSRNTSR